MHELQIVKYQKVLEEIALHIDRMVYLNKEEFKVIMNRFELELNLIKGCFE